ncbi:hypothetical protein MTO96_015833 [Rhipicephalus appendiculatus]
MRASSDERATRRVRRCLRREREKLHLLRDASYRLELLPGSRRALPALTVGRINVSHAGEACAAARRAFERQRGLFYSRGLCRCE